MSLHKRLVHPGPDVPQCWGCKVSGVQVAASLTIGTNSARRNVLMATQNFASEWDNGDRDAYRRLRADGQQPPRIAGSAHLERHASTPFEISSGQISREPRALAEALTACGDSGIDPLKANITPKG